MVLFQQYYGFYTNFFKTVNVLKKIGLYFVCLKQVHIWRLSKCEEYMKEIRIAELDLSDCIANFTEHELEVRNTKAKLEIMIDTLRDTLSEY